MIREKITVVIPANNEQGTIEEVITRCRPFCDEVVVVAALRSRDETCSRAHASGATVMVDRGKGKGDAIRTALQALSEGIVVFIDADGSHIPEDIPKLVGPVLSGDADMVIASRVTGGSLDSIDGHPLENFIRAYGSRCIAWLINARFRSRIQETQNGFRAMHVRTLGSLQLRADHTEVETEMCMQCMKKGLRIMEIPSIELRRKYGVSNIVIWRDAFRYARVILRGLFF